MAPTSYAKGIQEVGASSYAYLQPDGGWGCSNAGLVAGAETALLVDTLFDLPRTAEMLDALRRAVPQAAAIDVLVNTHADQDHTFGNQLAGGARIVASERAAEEMRAGEGPEQLAAIVAAAPGMGVAGEYLAASFGSFDFAGIAPVLPAETFAGELELAVGDVRVRLIEVGPAHTGGDTIVHVPDQGVVFTGDIVFAGVHPVTWAGSVPGWIAACDRILALSPDVVVPGHGPVTDRDGVRALRDYLDHVLDAATAGFREGRAPDEVVRGFDVGPYAGWIGPERLLTTVAAVHRELAGDDTPPDRLALLAEMGRAAA